MSDRTHDGRDGDFSEVSLGSLGGDCPAATHALDQQSRGVHIDRSEFIKFILTLASLAASIEGLPGFAERIDQKWLKLVPMQVAMLLPVAHYIGEQLCAKQDPEIIISSVLARACVTPLCCVLATPTAVAYVCSEVVPSSFIPYVLSPLQVVAGMSLWCAKLARLKSQLRQMVAPFTKKQKNIIICLGGSNGLLEKDTSGILQEIHDQMFAVIELNIYVVLASLCLSGIFARINAMTPHPSDAEAVALQLAPAILTLCVALFIYNRMKAISPDHMFRPSLLASGSCVFGGKQEQVLTEKLLIDAKAGDNNAFSGGASPSP